MLRKTWRNLHLSSLPLSIYLSVYLSARLPVSLPPSLLSRRSFRAESFPLSRLCGAGRPPSVLQIELTPGQTLSNEFLRLGFVPRIEHGRIVEENRVESVGRSHVSRARQSAIKSRTRVRDYAVPRNWPSLPVIGDCKCVSLSSFVATRDANFSN